MKKTEQIIKRMAFLRWNETYCRISSAHIGKSVLLEISKTDGSDGNENEVVLANGKKRKQLTELSIAMGASFLLHALYANGYTVERNSYEKSKKNLSTFDKVTLLEGTNKYFMVNHYQFLFTKEE